MYLKEKTILGQGYVKLVGVFGNDEQIEAAARVSYEKGTRQVSSTRTLLRYLMRHHHWTPFEMCEVLFELKLPLFIIGQLNRHRTANINQMSLRYSEAIDEFYVPEAADIQLQSSDNKQGRKGAISEKNTQGIQWVINTAHEHAYSAYRTLLGDEVEDFYDVYSDVDGILDADFKGVGIARETARAVLPTSNFSKMFWKCDLRNYMNLLRLRMDPHAQQEIRDMANAMYELTKDYFPIAIEAFDDYILHAETFSRGEMAVMKAYMQLVDKTALTTDLEKQGLSKREIGEFFQKIGK